MARSRVVLPTRRIPVITTASDEATNGFILARERYVQSLGLEAHIPILPKTYLMPYFGLEFIDGTKSDFGGKTHDSDRGKRVSIKVNHLF